MDTGVEDPPAAPPSPGPEAPEPGPSMWESGDPRKSSAALVPAGERLLEEIDLRFGARVLDVGSGTGNTALGAARRGARAYALDPSRVALRYAHQRAEAEGLRLRLVEGLSEGMPFRSAQFDAVLSTFGVMFTSDPDGAAGELIRVSRPGGVLALASWTPGGFLGELYRLVDPYGEGAVLPTIWGSRERVMAWFGRHADGLETATRTIRLRGPAEERYVGYLCENFGPLMDALADRETEGRAELKAAVTELCHRHNRSGDPSVLIPSEYLEAVVHLR